MTYPCKHGYIAGDAEGECPRCVNFHHNCRAFFRLAVTIMLIIGALLIIDHVSSGAPQKAETRKMDEGVALRISSLQTEIFRATAEMNQLRERFNTLQERLPVLNQNLAAAIDSA